MSKGSIAILLRADAGPGTGIGHAMRCLALGQAWRDHSARIVFATREGAPGVEARMRAEGIEIRRVEETSGASSSREVARIAAEVGASWAVFDGSPLSEDLIDALHDARCGVAMIDDEGTAAAPDVIINQNAHADPSMYGGCASETRLFLGPAYALLRREFRRRPQVQREFPVVGRNILVTLGGSDAGNATSLVLSAIEGVGIEPLDVVVAVGTSNVHAEAVSRQAAQSQLRIRVERDTTRMAELMAWADVAVSSGGSTVWELAFMGLPSLVGAIAADQRLLVASSLFFESLGPFGAVTLESLSGALRDLLCDRARRVEQCSRARALVDGRGCERVLSELSEINRPVRKRRAAAGATDSGGASDERQ